MTEKLTIEFNLKAHGSAQLINLTGPLDTNLRLLEEQLNVTISNRNNIFHITGLCADVLRTKQLLHTLWKKATTPLDHLAIHLQIADTTTPTSDSNNVTQVAIQTKRGIIRGRSAKQDGYLHAINNHDINFGIGPAGTGKTFLAVAMAIKALNESKVQRLILVRPAVEAGEHLGFLPGNLAQKINPYLRPLYDALYAMLGVDKVSKLLEKNIIEIAPLAYMRGRTLNNAFVILDEAQNTSIEQIKMFLTRIGFGSTAVITGDMTQIDLPKQQKSGLKDAIEIITEIKGISVTHFGYKNIVRHPLVARIVEAYDKRDQENQK